VGLNITCDTKIATLLLAVEADDGHLKFPIDSHYWPGLSFAANPVIGINIQLINRACDILGSLGQKIDIWQSVALPLLGNNRELESTLFVARLNTTTESRAILPFNSWPTLPDLIKNLPKDKNRLAYLKAWQVLSGGLEETTKILDRDEVIKHIRSQEKNT
jgi:hypothetical protein